jgi:hypothetical protein
MQMATLKKAESTNSARQSIVGSSPKPSSRLSWRTTYPHPHWAARILYKNLGGHKAWAARVSDCEANAVRLLRWRQTGTEYPVGAGGKMIMDYVNDDGPSEVARYGGTLFGFVLALLISLALWLAVGLTVWRAFSD